MRAKGLYRFYLYDNLSRVVMEGTCSACDRSPVITNTTYKGPQQGLFCTGYSPGRDLGLKDAKLEIANYYDGYSFLNLPVFKDSKSLGLGNTISEYSNASGLSTGTIMSTSHGELLLTTQYYNNKGQLIEEHRTLPDNSLLVTKNSYTFTGNAKTVEETLYKAGKTYKATTENVYNGHNDKIESTVLSIDDNTTTKISSVEYDDLGRILNMSHGNGSNIGNTNYSYNLHGWTTDIISNNFEEYLTYNSGQGTPYFNGNISTQQWSVADEPSKVRGYKFTYDKLNRLTNAAYGEGDSFSINQGFYNERISGYTANGAIKGIVRNGRTQSGGYGYIDYLNITLNGNQLLKVTDTAPKVLRNGAFDFYDNTVYATGAEYSYDENGAMTMDANRGITNIEYDLRNNPYLIQFSDGSQTEYLYTASGEKLRTIHRKASPNIEVPLGKTRTMQSDEVLEKDSTDYIENFVFENGRPEMYLFAGGYYAFNGSSASTNFLPTGEGRGEAYYYLTDHLGNNRVVVDSNDSIVQSVHYYPFGAVYADAGKNPVFQKYKYTGKELDLTHGLNTYDHGARQNISILGVWDRVDPLAEKYYNISPYTICGNRPILYIDLDGKDYWTTSDKNNILNFINAVGSGQSMFDFSGWQHSTDAKFLGKLTYNDKTHKYYTSYTEIHDNEVYVIGKCFDANLKPVTFSGEGYIGAYVFEPISWYRTFLTGGVEEFGGMNWKVNPEGRITGLPPIIGIVNPSLMPGGAFTKSSAIARLLSRGAKLCKSEGFSMGQKIYKLGNRYYSLDITGHKGGIFKVFGKRGGKLHRIGTADENLNIIAK